MSDRHDEREDNIALLIDADNASPEHLDEVLLVLGELGAINVRRAYGNWAKSSLKGWGNLTGIEMKLQRTYAYKGKRHSFLSAGCPAPKGLRLGSFKLARTSFDFTGGKALSSTVIGDCKVRG